MNGGWIEVLAMASSVACSRTTSMELAALRDSVEQACRTPVAFGWDRRAAAHAEIFNVLADAAGDPLILSVLSNGAGLAYDLMIEAGCGADGMIISSRMRLLTHLRAGEHEEAALEMGRHLRVLDDMSHVATDVAARESA
jgi:DNA-binding GntR family transcriptional regulator